MGESFWNGRWNSSSWRAIVQIHDHWSWTWWGADCKWISRKWLPALEKQLTFQVLLRTVEFYQLHKQRRACEPLCSYYLFRSICYYLIVYPNSLPFPLLSVLFYDNTALNDWLEKAYLKGAWIFHSDTEYAVWKHVTVLYTKRISLFLRNSLYYTFVGELNESMGCESDGMGSTPGPIPPLTISFS